MTTDREVAWALMFDVMDQVLDPEGDDAAHRRLVELGPIPIATWSREEVRRVIDWAEAGAELPRPAPVQRYVDRLEKAGLTR